MVNNQWDDFREKKIFDEIKDLKQRWQNSTQKKLIRKASINEPGLVAALEINDSLSLERIIGDKYKTHDEASLKDKEELY